MDNITQTELSRYLGVTKSFLCELLSGKKRPSLKIAEKLERKSGVGRIIWLYGDTGVLIGDLEKSIGRKINFRRGRPKRKGEE